jgi:transposase
VVQKMLVPGHTETDKAAPTKGFLVSTVTPICWGGRPHGIACHNWDCQHPIAEPPTTQYKRIAIDTSKAVFTLHGIDQQDRPVLRMHPRRAQLIRFFTQLPPAQIAMEACGGAHYWARERTALGHGVRLVPPQYVKPSVKRGKNDRTDAEAICEASGRAGMRFVPVKSAARQVESMVLKVRGSLVGQPAQLINALRGHAAGFGIITGKRLGKIEPLLMAIEHAAALPAKAKERAALLGRQLAGVDGKIKEIGAKLISMHNNNDAGRRLATIPGVGPITALTLALAVDPTAFESRRQ